MYKRSRLALLAILAAFLFIQVPKIGMRPAGENVFERQAQTTGIIRLYCFDPSRHPLASPQLPYGLGAFNMELTAFEWIQGAAARVIDGGTCESVETVAQTFALVAAVFSIVVAFLFGQALFGPYAAVFCALALAFDSVWLKFATYRLMDIRAVAFAFLGALLGYKKRWGWASAAWFVAGSHRPQAFMALGPFFLLLFWIAARLSGHKQKLVDVVRPAIPIVVGGAIALCYHLYSNAFNRHHDLPWFTWSGPRINAVYFGDWSHLVQFSFWKAQLFDWLHKQGLLIALAAILAFGVALKSKDWAVRALQAALLLSLPFLVGRIVYTSAFFTVFMWHDYYAIPLNGLGALSKGLILGFIAGKKVRPSFSPALLVVGLILGGWAVTAVMKDRKFTAGRTDPRSEIYQPDWEDRIFPKGRELVAIVNDGPARVVSNLYVTHHPGFTWCSASPELAPRAFWKKEGVKWVAWPNGRDPKTKESRWIIRTIDEELAYARARGWSSDANDYWAGHTMAEWAWFATNNGKDPCEGDSRDPRTWGFK